MTPENINSTLASRANVTRECLERVTAMSDAQLEQLAEQYNQVQAAQRNYDRQLRLAEADARRRAANPGVAERSPVSPPTGPRPEMPACGYEAQLEENDRRRRAENLHLRLGVTGYYAVLGSALGYVVGNEVLGRGREGAAAGAALAAIAGFIAAKDVRRGSMMW
jgi:hypothetical protein